MFTASASTRSTPVSAGAASRTLIRVAASTGEPEPSFEYSPAVGRDGLARGPRSVLVGTIRVEPIESSAVPLELGETALTPLDAARRILERHGISGLRHLKGRFALVAWLIDRRELLAVRDPLGLAPLYYRDTTGALLVSDNVDAIGADAAFDEDYIAWFIASRGNPNTTSTIRAGVRALAPGAWLRWKDGRITTGRFWSAMDIPVRRISREDAAAEFRARLLDSLRTNLDSDGTTWSHLSGGLDSSFIVSMAAAARETQPHANRLGGTLTFRSSIGNGDDSEFVGAVVQRYGVRNVTVSDVWPWRDDGLAPPPTDRPSRDYPYYARDRAAATAVTADGATAMLSGIGPDLYLSETWKHCPDLLWSGQLRAAVRELHAWSVARRESLWRVAITHGLLPLAVRGSPGWMQPGVWRVARWFTPSFRKRHRVGRLLLARNGLFEGARGRYYDYHVAAMLKVVAEGLSNWRYTPGLEMRHPFLHRPLVEYCLSLPLELRTDVYWPKPVLRGAAKGVLPEIVRHRTAGSLLAPQILWAFRHEQTQLQRLLQSPVLADLGCIDPARIRRTLASFDVFRTGESSYFYALLSLETWLSAKCGRWSEPRGWMTH